MKPLELAAAVTPDEVVCPNCGERQSKRLLCRSCSSNIEMAIAAKEEAEAQRRAERQAAFEARRHPNRRAAQADGGVHSAWPIGFGFSGRVGRLSSATGNLWLIAALLVLTAGFLVQPNLPRALLVGVGLLAVFFFSMRLTVLRCAFFDNEMGLLTSNVESASLQVVDSEFGQAPTHPGSLHHLLYIGRIAHASIRNSRFHDGHIGHLIKSRARETEVIGNTIVDGPQGRASYEIDLPNGGLAQVRGNTIGQAAGTDNPVIVSFGAEGAPWPVSGLTVEDNLITNDRPQGGTFVRVWRERLPADTPVAVRRNRLVGPGQLELGAGAAVEGNVEAARP